MNMMSASTGPIKYLPGQTLALSALTVDTGGPFAPVDIQVVVHECNHQVLTVELEPVVLGLTLAIARKPGPMCLRVKLSSPNSFPLIDPTTAMSPPRYMKLGMIPWKKESSKPEPFSQILKGPWPGTTSARSSLMTSGAACQQFPLAHL